MHFVAAMIYLGITFRFQDYNSQVYITWYIIGPLETIVHIGLSLRCDVLGLDALSFKRTHLIKRMGLLTLIIIGEGIIVVAKNVTTIVKNPNSWSKFSSEQLREWLLRLQALTIVSDPATVGVVISAVTTIYVVYQVYFDWKRHQHLPAVRQSIWFFLHFPFHLSLTLFVEGSSQFIIWWKILEVQYGFFDMLNSALSPADQPNFSVTTAWFVNTINETVNDIFNHGFSPKYYDTVLDVDDALHKLNNITNDFWSGPRPGSDENSKIFNESIAELISAVQNSLFAAFNIDAIPETKFTGDYAEFEVEANNDNWNRFTLVVSVSRSFLYPGAKSMSPSG